MNKSTAKSWIIGVSISNQKSAVFEITGKEDLPYFTPQVLFRSELVAVLRDLHQMIMEEERDFRKEESFFFLLKQLIEEYTEQALPTLPTENAEQSAQARIVCWKNITWRILHLMTYAS
ncbi:hypothetical protein [Anaerotignum sp. MB30-C6]|uniref:hypothetical protein n=1 Tax=Anaerotignum sp. MB30-C6 TaxID=3070814 RepID=UPI002F3F2B4C